MQHFFLRIATGKNSVDFDVKTILANRKIFSRKTLHLDISGTNQKESLMFYCMGKDIGSEL